MLNKSIALLCFLISLTPVAHAEGSGKAAANRLAAALSKVNSVSFYFLSRTGNYSIRGDELKAKSTTKIYRNCGNNCRSYMGEVISHLAHAKLAKCMPGQQNLLIEIGNVAAVHYSYSGRMIEFEGKCYFNERGIDSTIKSTRFIFN